MVKVGRKMAVVKTRYGSFSCVFEPERDMGGYVVTAPKVRGVVSWGKNLAEARRMVAEAIEGAHEAEIIIAAEKAGVVRLTNSKAVARRDRASSLARSCRRIRESRVR